MGYIIKLDRRLKTYGQKGQPVLEQIESESNMAEEVKPDQNKPVENAPAQTTPRKKEKTEVPIWHKANLTLEEAAAYFGIGINKLREVTNEKGCDFVLYVGTKRLIKRLRFEEFLNNIDTV